MPRGRPIAPLELSDADLAQLTEISRSRSRPSGLVQRAQIVLACAEGLSNTAVAARLGVRPATVGKWRKRYREAGLEGLHDELRSGRPRTYDDERVATLINDALQVQPPDRTHWSVRSMAAHGGVSKSTVQRWFTLDARIPRILLTRWVRPRRRPCFAYRHGRAKPAVSKRRFSPRPAKQRRCRFTWKDAPPCLPPPDSQHSAMPPMFAAPAISVRARSPLYRAKASRQARKL